MGRVVSESCESGEERGNVGRIRRQMQQVVAQDLMKH
jgi:hypothetical protein